MQRIWKLLAERMALEAGAVAGAYERFRQTRLYSQLVLSVGLGLLVLLTQWLPYGPLASARAAFQWVATHDTDLKGNGARVRRWADEQGGWRRSLSLAGEWASDRVEPYLRLLRGTGEEPGGLGPLIAAESSLARPTVETAPTARMLPVDGALLYGYEWRRLGNEDELHQGIDLAAEPGAPVRAIAAGRVVRLSTGDPTWGGLVEVEHGDEVALYAGLDKIRVTEGELVQAGQVLASIAAHPVGRERALGPHLHLEIRSKRAGVPVDPAPYLNLQGKGT